MAIELISGERAIESLKPGDGRLSDGGGLYLLPFFKGGSHHWRLDYTFEGKRKTLSLGVYPRTNLMQARIEAGKARLMVAAGQDPSQSRRAAKKAAECAKGQALRVLAGLPLEQTFEEVARRWFEVKRSQWMDSYSSKVIRRLELHGFPVLGRRPLSEITPKEVLEACRRVESNNTLETAHRLREHCSSVFKFAIAEGAELRDPCNDIQGALKKPQPTHFGAPTKPEQLEQVLRSIDGYNGSLVVSSALKLLPMLIVRPGELRFAKWDEFDLDNGLWYVPSARMKRTKFEKIHGQPHLVPLAKQAVQILEQLFQCTGPTGHVFPAEGRPGRCMSENTINAALRSMGYASQQATAHGFRATARTLIVEVLEYPESVIEMQLAHAVSDANGTAYNRTEFVRKRFEMMQTWADYLSELKQGKARRTHAALPEFKPVSARHIAGQLSPLDKLLDR